MLVGVVLGLVGVGFAAVTSDATGRIDLGCLLAGIGFVYLGFAIADGRRSALVVQIASVVVLLNVAYIGVQQKSSLLLGLGFLGHMVWMRFTTRGTGRRRCGPGGRPSARWRIS